MRRSTLSRARRNCTGLLRFSVRAEARVHPIGGYCNSCSFARWPGISSPQGQGAVSGILIGTSGLIFTSLHILLHLLENEEKSWQVWQSSNKRKTLHSRICISVPHLKTDFTEWIQSKVKQCKVSCLFNSFEIVFMQIPNPCFHITVWESHISAHEICMYKTGSA